VLFRSHAVIFLDTMSFDTLTISVKSLTSNFTVLKRFSHFSQKIDLGASPFMQKRDVETIYSLSFLGLSLLIAGCGGADRPPLGYVSGKVTLDGNPVENLTVIMKPENGRMGMGRTDKIGNYTIQYTEGEKGTKIGPTSVYVEWPTGVMPTFFIPKDFAPGTSVQKFEVKKGNQTYDLVMKADPPDPGQEGKKPFMVD